MSKTVKRGAVTPRMNITPLIDVVFLLIIFFMLVNNIVSEETVEMILPQLVDSEARETGDIDRVVVNVAPQVFSRDGRSEYPWNHAGTASYVKIGTGSDSRFEPSDATGITTALKRIKVANPEVQVLLRSDGAIYYEQVRPIMDAVAAAEIEAVNLVAYMSE